MGLVRLPSKAVDLVVPRWRKICNVWKLKVLKGLITDKGGNQFGNTVICTKSEFVRGTNDIMSLYQVESEVFFFFSCPIFQAQFKYEKYFFIKIHPILVYCHFSGLKAKSSLLLFSTSSIL